MAGMSGRLVISIFLIIIVIAIIACLIIKPGTYSSSRLSVFIAVFAGMSLSITVFFYFSLARLQSEEKASNKLDEMRFANSSIEKANLAIMQVGSVEFASELLPLQDVGVKQVGEDNAVNESTLSYTIFNTWQVVLHSHKLPSCDQLGNVCLFLQWATSERLRRQWSIQKCNFWPSTRRLGDRLFELASGVVNKRDPREYCELSKRVLRL